MDVRSVALALPASVTVMLIAIHGGSVLQGDAARSLAVLAATGVAGLLATALAGRLASRERDPALPPALEAVLRGATPLGDAVIALTVDGRVRWANEAATALAERLPGGLLGRSRDALGDDVSILLRGIERGPTSGRVEVVAPGSARRFVALATAVRVPGKSPLDLVVLRPEAAPEEEDAHEVDDQDIIAEPPAPFPVASAIPAELRGPLARASASAALLRMTLPAGQRAAAQHLGDIERELRQAEASLAALTTPLPPPALDRVDVDGLLSDALAGVVFAPAVRVTRVRAPSQAIADAGQLRQALRHLLRVAAAAMPAGGALALRTAISGGQVVVEIADTGAALDARPGLDLPLSQRLLAAQGGTVERTRTPGRGSLSRVSLPVALGAVRAAAS